MRKYFLTLFFVSILLFQYCSQQNDPVLFPEREVINKRSELFFSEISIGMPQLKDIPFFIKSRNYFSAYIKLSRVISKTPYFIKMFSYFDRNHIELIENFKRIKLELTPGNYISIKEKENFSDLDFYVLILHRLFSEYKDNKLSGNIAYEYWNIVLNIVNKLNKSKPTLENYAILQVTSRMFFLKKKETYKKKAKQLKKKIKEKGGGILLNYIINQGDIKFE